MTKKCTVFYVDNDWDDLNIFGEVCADLGYDVSLFDAPEKMIFSLEQTLPCVLFVDVSLPQSSGFEITAELKSHRKFKHIPIVVYSDTVAKKDIDRLVGLGADFVVKKPMNYAGIRAAVLDAFNHLDVGESCRRA